MKNLQTSKQVNLINNSQLHFLHLLFRFHSESNSMFSGTKITKGHGFQIEYSTHHCDISTNDGCNKGMTAYYNNSNGACGGNFTKPNGILTSPSYPDTYPNNVTCIYIISQRLGTHIKMKILSIDIPYESDYYDLYSSDEYDYHQYGGVTCDDDYLEIRDGASEQSPLIDGYCGDETVLSLPIVIQTTQNYVWMR